MLGKFALFLSSVHRCRIRPFSVRMKLCTSRPLCDSLTVGRLVLTRNKFPNQLFIFYFTHSRAHICMGSADHFGSRMFSVFLPMTTFSRSRHKLRLAWLTCLILCAPICVRVMRACNACTCVCAFVHTPWPRPKPSPELQSSLHTHTLRDLQCTIRSRLLRVRFSQCHLSFLVSLPLCFSLSTQMIKSSRIRWILPLQFAWNKSDK